MTARAPRRAARPSLGGRCPSCRRTCLASAESPQPGQRPAAAAPNRPDSPGSCPCPTESAPETSCPLGPSAGGLLRAVGAVRLSALAHRHALCSYLDQRARWPTLAPQPNRSNLAEPKNFSLARGLSGAARQLGAKILRTSPGGPRRHSLHHHGSSREAHSCVAPSGQWALWSPWPRGRTPPRAPRSRRGAAGVTCPPPLT
mmetsp:Transcript_114830/g.288596  ORF Transcript_114830/g.288596 Transcript_114830/m.288596 type:complete len:201 (-) Transcript_114830:15-617(-)